MKYVPKELPEGVNVAPTNVLAELLILLGALVVLAVGAFYGLGWTADRLVMRMSPELEARLGAQFDFGATPVPASSREGALLGRLLEHLPRDRFDLRLQIACTGSVVNAFAVPGGRVVLFHGLLETVKSENELAFVLAHEIGHFANRDHLRAFGRGLVWMTVATLVGMGGDFAADVLHDSGLVASRRFSQSQELAADRFAAELVAKAYGHAGGVTDFFRNPALRDGGGWLATHPTSRRRIRQLERLIAERGWTMQPVVGYAATPCGGGDVPRVDV